MSYKRKISFKEYIDLQARFTVARLADGVESGTPRLARGCKLSVDLMLNENNVEVGEEECKEIEKLRADRERLVEALRFYADKINWHYNSTNGNCNTGHKAHCNNVFIVEGDLDPIDWSLEESEVFGGNLARTTLKELGEME